MVDLVLLENEFRTGPNYLFHQPGFLRLHLEDSEGLFFQLADHDKIVASIGFAPLEDGTWRSPYRGTFGGYEVAPALSLEQLTNFHNAVEERVRRRDPSAIEILLAPQAHAPALFARQTYVLLASGFGITQADLNYTIAVDARPFTDRVSYGNRKCLKKCARQGLIAAPLPMHMLPKVYEALAENRVSKGNQLSMTLGQIEQMAAAFPDRLLLWGVMEQDTLAAASICLRLNDDILYVFYWGDRPAYSKSSPVVALAAEIYAWCQREGITMLDAGTSTIGAEPNYGLIRFKIGLGFEESIKLRVRKKFRD